MQKKNDIKREIKETEATQNAQWEGMPAVFNVCKRHKDQFFPHNSNAVLSEEQDCIVCQSDNEAVAGGTSLA